MAMKNKQDLPLEFVKKVKETILDKTSLEGEIKNQCENGNDIWVQDSVMPILDDNGSKIGEVVVRYDITDKKNLEKLAITDSLTQLYNRRHFDDILEREINRSHRDKGILSLIILDIDFFKQYNDAYGHKAGDHVLIDVAEAIKKSLNRGSDFAFRVGGEEFAVIFSGLEEDKAMEFAELIRANIESLQIGHSNSEASKFVTASIGLVVIDFATEGIDENGIYRMADGALYKAKESGRNRVSIHESEIDFF
ncbi:GGDEF domain-containing protein [Sulfurimonas sp.]|nr:GGDEF domain-containing protein [Sulfurimonas sp.]